VAAREVIEAARIEAGYPLFGVDMTEDTIPLEAGIEDRAISFTKGCYVGQEVIIRVLHRGHGRVAKKLVALRIEGNHLPARNAAIFAGDRGIGVITSAASSPTLGSIALGYVHRDYVAPGTRIDVEVLSGRVPAFVSESPIRP
jgi:folate-binding protein YgfZ